MRDQEQSAWCLASQMSRLNRCLLNWVFCLNLYIERWLGLETWWGQTRAGCEQVLRSDIKRRLYPCWTCFLAKVHAESLLNRNWVETMSIPPEATKDFIELTRTTAQNLKEVKPYTEEIVELYLDKTGDVRQTAGRYGPCLRHKVLRTMCIRRNQERHPRLHCPLGSLGRQHSLENRQGWRSDFNCRGHNWLGECIRLSTSHKPGPLILII